MPVITPSTGMPGYSAEKIAKHRAVAADGYFDYLPGGKILNGTKTRDPDNPDYNASTDPYAQTRLRAGLLLGKITSTGLYANAVVGTTNGAMTGTGTTLTLASAAQGVELARRVGASGTFKLTGPPTAAGTVRSLTVTYSAIAGAAVTITAMGVNEVQTVNLSTAGTGGSIRLLVQKPDGTTVLSPAAAWNATDATLLSNLNTALDTATGVVGGIVATAIAATDTDLGFVLTYSGTGYAGNTWALAEVHTLFTSNTGANVVRTTTGVDGRFVTNSLIGDTDGSHEPVSFLPCGWEMVVTDNANQPFARPPIAGNVNAANLLPWPADASTRAWVRDKLNAYGKFVFTEKY